MKNRIFLLAVTLGLIFTGCNQPKNNGGYTPEVVSGKIAYVNIDTLMEKYQLAIDLNEEFTKKQENMTADLNVQAKKVEEMIQSYQYRLQNNAITSRARAESEAKKIEEKRNELAELNQKLRGELQADYGKVAMRLQDSIQSVLKRYNTTADFDLILQTTAGGNVMLGKPQLNITNDIVKALNDTYQGKSSDMKVVEEK